MIVGAGQGPGVHARGGAKPQAKPAARTPDRSLSEAGVAAMEE